ncbi:MAG: imelysin family protein [Bacteroidota bacterium]
MKTIIQFRNWPLFVFSLLFLAVVAITISACETEPGEGPTEEDFTNLLTNQVDEVIIPTMEDYQNKMNDLVDAFNDFNTTTDANNLTGLRTAYHQAYTSYQAAAVHNYFATANQALVTTSNLYPVDLALLENLIDTESYNFSTTAQERANGFPAIDYMLYGPADVLDYFNDDPKTLAFLSALINSMKAKAAVLATQWDGSLRGNFIENGGTALGSSLSVQLNESLVYYEDHVRENKVGIPIGRLGPLDSPITPDPTKIEGYYQSQVDGNEDFTLSLVEEAIKEMEDIYLGTTSTGTDGQGYDDLLNVRGQSSVDSDIKAQFTAIYNEISNRSSISGDDGLYLAVQALVTLFKSDLFPVLNVQDADGLNDGD